MNRRDALAALVALPQVAKISVAPVRPKDVIVIESSDHISVDAIERIKQIAESVWPGQKVVVLEKSLTLKIVEGTDQ